MPYLDADPADLQRVHGLADADLPDAAILNGVWALESKLDEFCAQFSGAREVMERTALWRSTVAATLSIAQHFGVPAAAALVLIDNIGSDHTVFALTPDERERMHAARDTLVEATLMTAARAV